MKAKYYLEDYPYLVRSLGKEKAESIFNQVRALDYDTDFPPKVGTLLDLGGFILRVLQGAKANKRTVKVYKIKH